MIKLPPYAPPAPRATAKARRLTMDLGNGVRYGMVSCRACEAIWLGLWHYTDLWQLCVFCGQKKGREICKG